MSKKDEALKLALEALENILKNDGGKGSKCFNAFRLFDAREAGYKAITAIKEALAQPEQEPVAWAGVDFDIKTTPPQRKPLTDEEIEFIYADTGYNDIQMFARAIEAAHGIKGNT